LHVAVQQVRRAHVAQGLQHHVAHVRVLRLQGAQQVFHLLALQPLLRPAQVAGQDGERQRLGQLGDACLGTLDQRTDDLEAPVVGGVAGRHGLQLPAEERVHQEGLERVVAMVPERDLVAAEAFRRRVEDAAPQPRAQRAVRAARVHSVGHHRVRVLAQDLVGVATRGQPGFERSPVIPRLHLVEVHGDELDGKRQPRPQHVQQVQQRVAVLPAADGDHDPVPRRQQLVGRWRRTLPSTSASRGRSYRSRSGSTTAA
jgi:hypothetical protein